MVVAAAIRGRGAFSLIKLPPTNEAGQFAVSQGLRITPSYILLITPGNFGIAFSAVVVIVDEDIIEGILVNRLVRLRYITYPTKPNNTNQPTISSPTTTKLKEVSSIELKFFLILLFG